MKWRWIAGLVCALYLSVGLFAAVTHHHSDDALDGGQQCAACAWHHQAVDVPVASAAVPARQGIVIAPESGFFHFSDNAAGIHPSRGPPPFPQ